MVYVMKDAKMSQDEWKDLYRESIKQWKESYKRALKEWTDRLRDWKLQAKSRLAKGDIPPFPPLPHAPPISPLPLAHGGRSNVIASRIGDDELQSIDMLIEAGLFNTRSEAVAYLVREGIKARKDILDKVASALEEIRRIRKEAEKHISNLKKEIGLTETEKPENENACPKCGKDLSDLPEDIAVCPYCGTKLNKS